MDTKQQVRTTCFLCFLSLLVLSIFVCLLACLLEETDELWHTAQLPNGHGSCRATDIFDDTHIERVMKGSERSNKGHCCTTVASAAPSKVRQEGLERRRKSLVTCRSFSPSFLQWILLRSAATSSRWAGEHVAPGGRRGLRGSGSAWSSLRHSVHFKIMW